MKKKTNLLLGAHMSINGGVDTSVDRATSIGCTTMQIFTKNNNQWFAKPLTEEVVLNYKTKIAASNIKKVVSHDSYLINLCAINPDTLKKSRISFVDEIERCSLLGVEYLNFHPGAHMGMGEDEGIKKIIESLDIAHEKTRKSKVFSVVEVTAGQGTAIGYKFEHIEKIITGVSDKKRMAVCIDTCHIFAAGYDFTTKKKYLEVFKNFDEIVGIKNLVAFHLNDSKKVCGSRVDRHEHIGKGAIGLDGFKFLMNDKRFDEIPKILETPKEDDMREDVENMNLLKKLIK